MNDGLPGTAALTPQKVSSLPIGQESRVNQKLRRGADWGVWSSPSVEAVSFLEGGEGLSIKPNFYEYTWSNLQGP